MRSRAIFRVIASVLLIAGCSSESGDTQTSSSETTTTSSTQVSSSASTSTQTSTATPEESFEQVPPAASPEPNPVVVESEAAAQPTFVRCYENNAAMLSDGSVVTDVERCGDFAVPEAEVAPGEEECVGPAAVCGYGYDESGKRNPTSGEIQTHHGCQEGYINDPELCAAAAAIVEGS